MKGKHAILLVACATACAAEAPRVQEEIDRLDRAASHGVAAVRRALSDPSLEFSELGSGVETIEIAARALRSLSEDDRISGSARVSATLAEARAYDDLALTFESTDTRQELAVHRDVIEEIFREKAIPARMAARDAYVRARALACRTGYAEPATMLEILDGVSRYVSEDAVREPCG